MEDKDRPAFPVINNGMRSGTGLTKREMFALSILNGYISAGSTGMPSVSQLVELSIETADKLLSRLDD